MTRCLLFLPQICLRTPTAVLLTPFPSWEEACILSHQPPAPAPPAVAAESPSTCKLQLLLMKGLISSASASSKTVAATVRPGTQVLGAVEGFEVGIYVLLHKSDALSSVA